MADVITTGQKDTVSAVYSMSDGTTQPGDDIAWSIDNTAVASLSAESGPSADVVAIDLADGSLTPVQVTATGRGFTATVEIDVQASTSGGGGLTTTGIVLGTSGPQPV